MPTIFITGTDTGVGKTHVARLLLEQARAEGIRCAGFKPVAAGATDTAEGPRNEDALALQAAASVELPYELVNPYLLPEPVAPHIAAAEAGVRMGPARILQAHAEIAARADLVVVEGAGGWQVPLTEDLLYSELVTQAGWPVLLVVGMRLGCLNHALLSAQAIRAVTRLTGWVANCLPPRQPRLEANLMTLGQRLPEPLLGVIPPAEGGGDWTRWPRLSARGLLGTLD
ncbi:MAG TPA: dethiobiotin synthase [Nevskiales bacterium]|nr:dethiobiotin synthase [Nevskiales bacterium]